MNRTLLLVITCLTITTSVSAWNWFGLKPDPKYRAYSKLIGSLNRELSAEFVLKGCIVILCAERMIQSINKDEKARFLSSSILRERVNTKRPGLLR